MFAGHHTAKMTFLLRPFELFPQVIAGPAVWEPLEHEQLGLGSAVSSRLCCHYS